MHPATQHVAVTTSALDRAKGYQLVIIPLAVVVGLLAVLVSLLLENELLSVISLIVFWLSFCLVYLAGWVVTSLATPEFVSWYSARRQWDVIAKEQTERWAHYRWQTKRAEPVIILPWWKEYKPWIVAFVILWTLLVVVVAVVVWG